MGNKRLAGVDLISFGRTKKGCSEETLRPGKWVRQRAAESALRREKSKCQEPCSRKGHSNKQSLVCLRNESKVCDWTCEEKGVSWDETEEGLICENNTGCWNKPKLWNHPNHRHFLFIEYTKWVFLSNEQLFSKSHFGDYSFFHLTALPFLMSFQGQHVCLHGRLHMRGFSRPRSAWELCFHFILFPWACT